MKTKKCKLNVPAEIMLQVICSKYLHFSRIGMYIVQMFEISTICPHDMEDVLCKWCFFQTNFLNHNVFNLPKNPPNAKYF